MFGGFNWSDTLPYVAALAVILTVIVALYGLRQGHYSKSKLTRRGKRAVAAILLLGLVSLVSGIADRYVSAVKEEAEAEERTRQFERQMASLQRVTGDLGTVRGSLQDSLRRQEQLYGVANQNLRMSGALQTQAQANTVSVLRRVFAESNRVAAERIALSVENRCTSEDQDQGIVIPEQVSLTVVGRSGRRVTLATNQKLDLGDGMVFHGFLGDLGDLETFRAWRSASVSLRIIARRPLGTPMNVEEAIEHMRRYERRGNRPPPPPACRAAVMLLLNGRTVLRGEARFAAGADSYHVAELPNLRIDPNRLPQFAP